MRLRLFFCRKLKTLNKKNFFFNKFYIFGTWIKRYF